MKGFIVTIAVVLIASATGVAASATGLGLRSSTAARHGPMENAQSENPGMPHLQKHGTATQLIVNGKPFLMLAGELLNSSSSSLAYMRPIWPRLAAIPVNTVLTPVYWDLIEPAEGKFNFTLVDGLIRQARESDLHIVFLWFGAWKNGLSGNAPLWVRKDPRRFPLVIGKKGNQEEVLSTFGTSTLRAEQIAFAALMRNIRQVDGRDHTVLMMQVENEVHAWDYSPAAIKLFKTQVPARLLNYIDQHKESLVPQFKKIWYAAGEKTSGTWSRVFGVRAYEMFMDWHYARYINRIAAAGKAEYPIPMYVNTALMGINPNVPMVKNAPGGPTPAAMDVWRAAGHAINFYSPDIYMKKFQYWCNLYTQAGNPFFIPEAIGGPIGAANVFYAIGEDNAMGFSPFGIDSSRDLYSMMKHSGKASSFFGAESVRDERNALGRSYSVLMQMAPILLQHQGNGTMTGFVLDSDHPAESVVMNGDKLDISLERSFFGRVNLAYGLVVATGPNEFLGAGNGFQVTFSPASPGLPNAGIGYIEQGSYSNGDWIPGRRLSGDADDQGEAWLFAAGHTNIERAVVYRF
ncbi:MAG: DUF5597 domain-containing protein [Acidithiobacillus sp.]|jgi:hypothetical protein|nr:DUF5597 domain-containing protein [Acidithiobacillus sp.]